MDSLEHKVAVVTGGGSGIGLAMTRSFAARGANVMVLDVEESALQSVQAEFKDSNATVRTLLTDVTDEAQMEASVRETASHLGPVNILANNAGIVVAGKTIGTTSIKDWTWTMQVNMNGVFHGIHVFLPHMLEHGGPAHIVNTGSVAGLIAVPGVGAYASSKFGVVGLSLALRAELAETNVDVSVLCPGMINTNILTAARNRPDTLLDEGQSNNTSQGPDSSIMDNALDPAVVGEMVSHGILNNEFYILTHPQYLPAIQAVGTEIAEASSRWSAYRAEHAPELEDMPDFS